MFVELLESRAKPVRNRAGAIASVVGHGVFIALAVAATRSPLIARGPTERVVALPVLNPPSPPRPSEPAEPMRTPVLSTPGTSAPLMVAVPVIVLPGIPPIDLTQAPATGIEWRSDGRGLSPGITTRAPGGSDDGIPFAPGVDKPAIALAGNPAPRYPEILRRANVRGEVVVQVVIDTTGRADMTTLRVMSSDHPLLTDAVLAVLPRARFLSAETGGRKVRMWAVQSFVFEVK